MNKRTTAVQHNTARQIQHKWTEIFINAVMLLKNLFVFVCFVSTTHITSDKTSARLWWL